MSTSALTFEKNSNMLFGKYIYAVFADIEAETARPVKYSQYIYQNYANLIKSKDDKVALKNRFLISDPVRQHLTFLFKRMITEITNVSLTQNDNVITTCEKVTEANTDCYTEFMYSVGGAYKTKYGPLLSSASDSTDFFYAQTCGLLPQYASNKMIIAMISTEFNMFLKSLAWFTGQLIWYSGALTITSNLFDGLLSQLGMSGLMIDEMMADLRAKPPTKPRAKKTGASSAQTAANTNDTAGDTVGDAADDAADDVDDTPNVTNVSNVTNVTNVSNTSAKPARAAGSKSAPVTNESADEFEDLLGL